MIRLFCQDRHQGGDGLCPECTDLLAYAMARLERCPFQEGKTTCAKCPVHCYQPQVREAIRTVMRYAGPRMPYRHPVLTWHHLRDGLRKTPRQPRRQAEES